MITETERHILKAYLSLSNRNLLNHRYESEEDYLAGYVDRFLRGERFSENIEPFTENDYKEMYLVALQNLCSTDGKDLLTALYITKAVCNILSKYRRV